MQALEIEVDITPDGQLLNARLPTSCESMFGKHTKLIMILQEPQLDVHGETVLNFLTSVSQYNFSRILRHS
jgi:hypothetical protein